MKQLKYCEETCKFCCKTFFKKRLVFILVFFMFWKNTFNSVSYILYFFVIFILSKNKMEAKKNE